MAGCCAEIGRESGGEEEARPLDDGGCGDVGEELLARTSCDTASWEDTPLAKSAANCTQELRGSSSIPAGSLSMPSHCCCKLGATGPHGGGAISPVPAASDSHFLIGRPDLSTLPLHAGLPDAGCTSLQITHR